MSSVVYQTTSPSFRAASTSAASAARADEAAMVSAQRLAISPDNRGIESSPRASRRDLMSAPATGRISLTHEGMKHGHRNGAGLARHQAFGAATPDHAIDGA
jgi:hypothetical protein